MKIVINDANILIDLVKLKLLQQFAQLPFQLYTTDVVYEEIKDHQKEPIRALHKKELLYIIEIEESSNDYDGIFELLIKSNGLSFEDCSVLYYSKKMEGTLLTGDGKLRKFASKDNVEVRGVIYIFDELLDHGLLDYETAFYKIKELCKTNNRLPKKQIESRIKLWESKI